LDENNEMSLQFAVPSDMQSHKQITELVRGAAQGQEAAWRALVDNFASLVWSVIQGYRLNAADGADVSQTTWLRLAEHISSVRQPERVGAWLVTTAGRECLALLRRRRRQSSLNDACFVEESAPEQASQPEAHVIKEEEDETLWQALASLPDRHQILLRLLFADPAPTYQEISAVTGMPVGSIGPVRRRCLAQLREYCLERRQASGGTRLTGMCQQL
jgi:RNA polymerase sigma factor (sigma-70 family)